MDINKIQKALVEDRNDYAKDCNRRIAEEKGKIIGADYMLQRFLDILRTEVDPTNAPLSTIKSIRDKEVTAE